MKNRKIILERREFEMLDELLRNSSYTDAINQKCVDTLKNEIKFATIVEDDEMPDHIVRINSMVDVETPYGVKHDLQIVVPAERNVEQDKISVLSPMGSALVGYGAGDTVKWMFPKGEGKIKILKVKNAPKSVMRETR
ncbi:MAG TPA: GreA/GreB family elongation factor [Fulvivirga sp.]|nr:GreA/GreB family elongation factor [Fulvivirga sp.]